MTQAKQTISFDVDKERQYLFLIQNKPKSNRLMCVYLDECNIENISTIIVQQLL